MPNSSVDISDLFEESAVFQAYLDIEAALAKAQAEQGIIPKSAASKIADSAKLELLNLENIRDGLKKTGHPLVPIIWELDRVCGPEAGGYIHWGATTQNITQTGKLLLVKRCHALLLRNLARLLEQLSSLALQTKGYVMAGRTHGQHAVPITFGYKVAVWIDEILRHLERLQSCEKRVFTTMLGGGAGTLASVGKSGLKTQELMAKELSMQSMTMPSRVITDHLVEYIMTLALLGATGDKIAREIRIMMKQEFGEVEEAIPPGTVGSSTMPQKRNPKHCQNIVAQALELKTIVPLALDSMQQEHEADGAADKTINIAIDKACILTGGIITNLNNLFQGLNVFPERMRENLDLSKGLIMSERIMLALGAQIGRQRAHDVIYDAAQKAVNEDRPFKETLQEENEMTTHFSSADIDNLLDPETYTGLCIYFADTFAARARKVIATFA